MIPQAYYTSCRAGLGPVAGFQFNAASPSLDRGLLAEIEGPLTEGQREDLRMIRASGEHLRSLFNNVLDFSALASGRIQLKLEPVNVSEVLEEVASLLEGQRQGKSVAIVVDVPEHQPEIDADPRAIEDHFELRCRAVLRVPYDRHLDSGSPVDYRALSAESRRAWLRVAAVVADGL